MATEFVDEFEGVDDASDESETGTESRSPEGSAGSAGGDESPKPDKRINDLMSKWQSAQARAEAAEKRLAELETGTSTPSDGKLPDTNPEVRVFLDQILEGEIDRVYGADPRLAAYGIDRLALWAPTPAEVKANAERMKALVDRMETQIENRVMQRHGVSPGVAGGRTSKPRDWASMSSDDFEKVLAEERRRF
jgi:hypothetical protein